MTPTAYLKKELRFSAKEWARLTNEDKAVLRSWAEEEMEALAEVAGQVVREGAA